MLARLGLVAASPQEAATFDIDPQRWAELLPVWQPARRRDRGAKGKGCRTEGGSPGLHKPKARKEGETGTGGRRLHPCPALVGQRPQATNRGVRQGRLPLYPKEKRIRGQGPVRRRRIEPESVDLCGGACLMKSLFWETLSRLSDVCLQKGANTLKPFLIVF